MEFSIKKGRNVSIFANGYKTRKSDNLFLEKTIGLHSFANTLKSGRQAEKNALYASQ